MIIIEDFSLTDFRIWVMIIIEDFNLTDFRIWVMIIIEDFNLTVILEYELYSLLKILIWPWF